MNPLDNSAVSDQKHETGRTIWEWCRLGLWAITGLSFGYFGLVPGRLSYMRSESPPEGVAGAIIFGVLFLLAGWLYEVFTHDKFRESPRKLVLWVVILIGLIPIGGIVVIALVLLINSLIQ